MQTADIWLRDMPQQFQGKYNIEVLIKAFSRQMQELERVFRELNTMTDIDTAVGQNLDYVGTIIPLTRKEAGELAGIGVTYPIISDERYRKFLRYKALRNTNNCTYYDIMESIEILWDTSNIRYVEDPGRPATILIRLQTMRVDSEIDPADGKVMAVKSAGVALVYTVNYEIILNNAGLEKIECSKLKLHYELPFYLVRLFDGSWMLDGSCLLDAERSFETQMNIRIKGLSVHAPELYGNQKLAVRLRDAVKEDVEVQDVKTGISVEEKSVSTECVLKLSCPETVTEEAFDGYITSKRNLWYFDGTYLMDGTRLLNAEKIKEDI